MIKLDSIFAVESKIKSAHTLVIVTEEERRQAEKEFKERKAFEKAERKRLRMEWKLRRRENRRLFALEQQFNDLYAASADIDREIINVSDIDGSDGNQMKTVGLRGGLIGEFFNLMKYIQKIPGFEEISPDWPNFSDLVTSFWHSAVGEGWTVYVGLDPSFETNTQAVSEGVSLEDLNVETLHSYSYEEQESLLEYFHSHYSNSFWDQVVEGFFASRQRAMAKLKFEEPDEEHEGKEEGKEEGREEAEGEEETGELEENGEEKSLEIESSPQEEAVAEPEEEIPDSPEVAEIKNYLQSIFKMMLSQESPLKNVRFAKSDGKPPQTEKHKEIMDIDEKGEENEPEEELPPPKDKILAIYIPQAPLDEKEEPLSHPLDYKPMIPEELLPPSLIPIKKNSEDEEEEEKEGEEEQELKDEFDYLRKPVAIEIYPHRPFDVDFEQEEFDSMVSNIDITKPDIDVAMVHLPLIHQLTIKFVESVFAQMQREDPDQEEEIIRTLFKQAVGEIRQLGKCLNRDTLYVNSY